MVHAGWDVVPHLGRNEFYAAEQNKEFCIGDKFRQCYLLALLQSDQLFSRGLQAVFHAQSNAYYEAILRLAELGDSANDALKNLQPNKTAREYKALIASLNEQISKSGTKSKVHTDTKQDDFSKQTDEHSILSGGLQAPETETEQMPKQQKRKATEHSASLLGAAAVIDLIDTDSDSDANIEEQVQQPVGQVAKVVAALARSRSARAGNPLPNSEVKERNRRTSAPEGPNAIEATLPAQSGPSPSQSSSSASRPSAPAPVQVLQPGQELGGASSSRATPPARDKAAANSEPKRIDCQQVLPERRAPGEASSIYSLSTIWFGSVPIIKRLDKGSEAWLDRLDPILFVHVYLLQFKTALLSLSCHGPGATASQH